MCDSPVCVYMSVGGSARQGRTYVASYIFFLHNGLKLCLFFVVVCFK